MPSRLRNRHLADIFEAMIRYESQGRPLDFESSGDNGDLVVTIRMGDPQGFNELLSKTMDDHSAAPELQGRSTEQAIQRGLFRFHRLSF